MKEEDQEEEDYEEEEEQQEEKPKINPPQFSRISGFYPDTFKLKLFSKENYTIYYTVDSTDPRNSSSTIKYKDHILIYDKSSEPNVYSAIGVNDSSPVSIAIQSRFSVPFYPVDKAMIIRAVAKNSDGDFSEIITKTYFVTNEGLYKYQDITVVSLVTSPENLFDPDYGIYVSGNMFQRAKNKKRGKDDEPFNARKAGSNFQQKGKEWERESFITFFDKGEINLQQKVGLRIKGAYTRMYPSKSFNIFAKKKYGKKTIDTNILSDNYDINGDLITSYKALSLRNIYDSGRLRDKFGRDLFYVREGLAIPNMRNAALFLNGEYWGMYLIQEKIDDVFIGQNYLIKSKKIVLGKANKYQDGPEEEFDNFNYFCGNYSKKDVSNETIYKEVANYIDMESFVDLFATGLYIANTDWPGNNDGEWKYVGKPKEGNKFSDGKWRFLLYDLDYSMNSPNSNSFMAAERKNKYPYVQLFLNLAKNSSEFKHKLANTVCDYANNVYDNDTVKNLVEKYREDSTDLVANSQLRWSGRYYKSMLEGVANYKTGYYRALDSLQSFYARRAPFMFTHMKQFLNLKGDAVDLTIEVKGRGKVQINSIFPRFKNGIWTGKYFSKIPITIKAIPDHGYTFKEWDGYIQSNHQDIEIILVDSSTLVVIFE